MAVPQKTATPSRDLTAWLTREQASDLLGVSYETIRRYEQIGRLHAEERFNPNTGRVARVYEPAELAKIPRRFKAAAPNEQGELCARIFELLDAGRTVREIVIECRETATKVDEIKEQWLDAGGGELAIAPAVKAELERALGPFATAAELVKRVRERIASPVTPAGVTP